MIPIAWDSKVESWEFMSDTQVKERKELLARWDKYDESYGKETATTKAKRELAEAWRKYDEQERQEKRMMNQNRSRRPDPEGWSTMSQPVLRPRR